MICLKVADYCASCGDFEADVEHPTKLYFDSDKPLLSGDTVIRCKHRGQCDRIRRYRLDDNKEE